jgi:hypothetical protein
VPPQFQMDERLNAPLHSHHHLEETSLNTDAKGKEVTRAAFVIHGVAVSSPRAGTVTGMAL